MRSSHPSHCPHDFFAALEARQYLSNPTIVDFTVDTPDAYPGKVITLTAHATAPAGAGVRAVVFWIENNDDALNQFVLNSFDQSLGDVRTPDNGTTDRYSIQVRVGASWQPFWHTSTKFGVDVVDTNGNFSQSPIHFVSIDAKQKPFVQRMFAEPTGGGDIHLYAFTSVDGATVTGNGIGGVTFFLDQNGNNQWDAGTDIDLGVGTNTSAGVYEKTITPQGGWNLTWFTASAFDARASGDRFGPNHSTVLRGDATPPVVALTSLSDGNGGNYFTSDETARFYVQYSAPATMLGATFFHDRNQNGLWDAGIDTPLLQYFSGFPTTTGYADLFQALGQLGHGWQSVGIAVHDASGRGDDSWSAVMTVWINVNNTPWVTNPVVAPSSIPLGTQTIDLTFDVHDDDGVQGITQSFVDINGNGGYAETGETHGTNLTYLTPGQKNATWRLTFYVGDLPRGTYAIDIWLTDYVDVRGPRMVVPFSIV